MSSVKAICLTLLFGFLSIIVTVLGAIVGVILAAITPILLVFTGLWVAWFVCKDYDDSDPEKKSGSKD